jgi:hypothetical protein
MLITAYHSIMLKCKSLDAEKSMQCPNCHQKSVKNGRRRGKQSWLCKNCSYQYVEDALPVGSPKQINYPECPYCRKNTLNKNHEATQSYRCYFQCRNPKCERCSTFELDEDDRWVRVLTTQARRSLGRGKRE